MALQKSYNPFDPRAGLQSLQRIGSRGRFGAGFGPVDWTDPAAVEGELNRLKDRQREINVGANPALGGMGGMGINPGLGGVSPFA